MPHPQRHLKPPELTHRLRETLRRDDLEAALFHAVEEYRRRVDGEVEQPIQEDLEGEVQVEAGADREVYGPERLQLGDASLELLAQRRPPKGVGDDFGEELGPRLDPRGRRFVFRPGQVQNAHRLAPGNQGQRKA